MNNITELRVRCASALLGKAEQASALSAFVGLDGFVDEILHTVDKRESAEVFQRLPSIARLAERLGAAAGKSANLELVSQMTKLGGNGPIMANALSSLGMKVSYLGLLGYPNLHPVFHDFAKGAEVYSIADPGTTDALEFEDGKIMIGKHGSLKEMTWENILSRFGREKFAAKFGAADLVGFVNWTMLPYMSGVWEAILREVCPGLKGARRRLFFDLADPEKRTRQDIVHALDLIGQFEKYFDVILGLNEKEAHQIGEVFGLRPKTAQPESLGEFALEVGARLKIGTLVIHPVACALAVSDGKVDLVDGPYVAKPLITTGAGDHFNSGFCLGKLLGLDNALSLLTGVATSGYYVRTGKSPSIAQLAILLKGPFAQIYAAMILEIVKYGNPVLRHKGARVEKITVETKQLIADMLETMHEAKGIGLAAQQVGKALQLTVLDVRGATDRPSTFQRAGKEQDANAEMPLILINPEVKPSGESVAGPEGCLSFPEIFGDVSRPPTAEVRAMNEKGEMIEFQCGGLLARAIQHELDHLNGILFIDRMSRAEKEELKPKLEELQARTKAELKKAQK